MLNDYVVWGSSSLVINNGYSICTYYLFVIDYFNLSKDEVLSKVRVISEQFKLQELNISGIYPRNLVDIFKLYLFGCPIFLNTDGVCEYIKLSTKGISLIS